MKKSISMIIVLSMLAFAAAYAASVLWTVKQEGVKVSFELPDGDAKGTLSGLKATIDFDKKNLEASKITATVDVNTIDTKDEKRDTHLKTADFFEAAKFPVMTFTSTKIKADGKGYIATGTLAIKDSVKTIDMPFTFQSKKNAGVFKGSFTMNAGDFGIMKKGKKDKVIVSIVVPVTK